MRDSKLGNILIVDNDEEVLIALERLFEDQGYDTSVTLDVDNFQAFSSKPIDLVVLDDHLSSIDCIHALTELRRSGARVPVIVTYHRCPSDPTRRQLEALGVFALINKCSHTQLAAIAHHLLAGRAPDAFECMT